MKIDNIVTLNDDFNSALNGSLKCHVKNCESDDIEGRKEENL